MVDNGGGIELIWWIIRYTRNDQETQEKLMYTKESQDLLSEQRKKSPLLNYEHT